MNLPADFPSAFCPALASSSLSGPHCLPIRAGLLALLLAIAVVLVWRNWLWTAAASSSLGRVYGLSWPARVGIHPNQASCASTARAGRTPTARSEIPAGWRAEFYGTKSLRTSRSPRRRATARWTFGCDTKIARCYARRR